MPVEGEVLKIDASVYKIFISKKSEYLQEIEHEGVCYIGKFLGGILTDESLILVQENLKSILKKVLPDFSINSDSLILFPIIKK